MGKKIVKLTESELINLVRKVIREQKISDLPKNQQSLTPKPNLSSTKSKDLRSTLTPQQQQQVKDITRGRNDLSKQYYSNQTTNKTDNCVSLSLSCFVINKMTNSIRFMNTRLTRLVF
jgi:hypothetical protein